MPCLLGPTSFYAKFGQVNFVTLKGFFYNTKFSNLLVYNKQLTYFETKKCKNFTSRKGLVIK